MMTPGVDRVAKVILGMSVKGTCYRLVGVEIWQVSLAGVAPERVASRPVRGSGPGAKLPS